jgi:hypothetical protein
MASRRRVDLGVEEEGVAEMKWKRDPQDGGAMVFYLNTLGRRRGSQEDRRWRSHYSTCHLGQRPQRQLKKLNYKPSANAMFKGCPLFILTLSPPPPTHTPTTLIH